MSYTALYRKYRPTGFEDVVEQQAVVRALTNQIKSGRIGHAYLFCGTRGTGKTTLAKIFARAVNCENPVNGSPCNECRSCRSILDGSSMNVAEVDAASNNGVDYIRQIRDEVKYSPSEGKYRVYIIDEVHMLTPGAYNALLKTLEEPPSYVIFILATTEAHRIPVTVLSRCQRYDFRRISAEGIYSRLAEIAGNENIDAQEKALRYIARCADGAMRDALSILEECVACCYGQCITYEKVLDVVGAEDTSVYGKLLDCIIREDLTGAFGVVDDMVYSGRDLAHSASEFVWFLRNLMIIQTSSITPEELGLSQESYEHYQEISKSVSMDMLMYYIRLFSDLCSSMKYASDKRTLLELAVIRAVKPQTDDGAAGLKNRISVLESKLEQLTEAISTGQAAVKNPVREEKKNPPKRKLTPAQMADEDELRRNWHDILNESKGAFSAYLKNSFPVYVSDGVFELTVNSSAIKSVSGRAEVLEKATEKILNKEIKYKIVKREEISPIRRAKGPGHVDGISMDIVDEED